MIKYRELNFNKEELNHLLTKLDKDKDKDKNIDIYNKLEEAYLFISHQENAVKLLKQYYKDSFVDCEYCHIDSNYDSGLLKYNIYYEMINQETYLKEIIKDVEIVQFVKKENAYKYILIFHKRED